MLAIVSNFIGPVGKRDKFELMVHISLRNKKIKVMFVFICYFIFFNFESIFKYVHSFI